MVRVAEQMKIDLDNLSVDCPICGLEVDTNVSKSITLATTGDGSSFYQWVCQCGQPFRQIIPPAIIILPNEPQTN